MPQPTRVIDLLNSKERSALEFGPGYFKILHDTVVRLGTELVTAYERIRALEQRVAELEQR